MAIFGGFRISCFIAACLGASITVGDVGTTSGGATPGPPSAPGTCPTYGGPSGPQPFPCSPMGGGQDPSRPPGPPSPPGPGSGPPGFMCPQGYFCHQGSVCCLLPPDNPPTSTRTIPAEQTVTTPSTPADQESSTHGPVCAMPMCSNDCPGERKDDAVGCPTCECCPSSSCPELECEFGVDRGEDNCPLCTCTDPCKNTTCSPGSVPHPVTYPCLVPPCPVGCGCRGPCPDLQCDKHCPWGHATGRDGCSMCRCNPDPCTGTSCDGDEICDVLPASCNSPPCPASNQAQCRAAVCGQHQPLKDSSWSDIKCNSAMPCPPGYRCNDEEGVCCPASMCSLPPESGNCQEFSLRFFYNPHEDVCETFPYSGCGGNQNRFLSMRSCERVCGGSVCPGGQEFSYCRTCIQTCDNLDQPCTTPCHTGCRCPTHKPVWHMGMCVDRSKCPALTTVSPPGPQCPSGEYFSFCGTCPKTCENPDPICIAVCTPGCQCPSNRQIRHSGRCIPQQECPAKPKPTVPCGDVTCPDSCIYGCETTPFTNCPTSTCRQYDPCIATTCPVGTYCKLGDCLSASELCEDAMEPNRTAENPCNVIDCAPGHDCLISRDGQGVCCQDSCPDVTCPDSCILGCEVSNGCPTSVCRPIDYCTLTFCPEGTYCRNGSCINMTTSCLRRCPYNLTCPAGLMQDENGCVECKCRDPCEMKSCEDDEVCVLQDVQCVRAPCPPQAICTKNVCPVGKPLMDESGVRNCSLVPEGEARCPAGYNCVSGEDDISNCCAASVCHLPPDSGTGQIFTRRWFYNGETSDCSVFYYGGQGGNENRFISQNSCRQQCVCLPKPCAPPPEPCLYGVEKDSLGCDTCNCYDPCKDRRCSPGTYCKVINFSSTISSPLFRPIIGICVVNVTRVCSGGRVFSDCASCTKTCENPDLGCVAECKSECTCPSNRPIWHEGECIPQDQCPAAVNVTRVCSGGRVFTDCLGCTIACKPASTICHGWCLSGCTCPSDRPVWHEGECIPQDECPTPVNRTEPCPGGQVYSGCASPCTLTCETPRLSCPTVCVAGCTCPRDSPIWHNGGCIAQSQCPSARNNPCAPFGEPLVNITTGDQLNCGRGGQACPTQSYCKIHPADRYAVCCPVSCSAPAEVGPCDLVEPRWYYDSTDGLCQQFDYGGCEGNSNNFMDRESCIDTCHGICLMPKKIGPCKAIRPRWFFNSISQQCEMFSWGGCEANGNNFESLEQCENNCQRTTCLGDQVFSSCASPCTPTCEDPDPVCIEVCREGCACPSDRPILYQGQCITANRCPK